MAPSECLLSSGELYRIVESLERSLNEDSEWREEWSAVEV
jgi:hypothetical protein